MNPFPEKIITPSSAHRIPESMGKHVIEQLVLAGINAYAFLMDDDLLDEVVAKGFANDIERAKSDLLSQLPEDIRSTISFEKPSPLEAEAESTPVSTDVPATSAILHLLYDHRKQQAEKLTLKQNALEELFLLGISIGKGERLDRDEETGFRNTFGAAERTARVIAAAGSIPEMEDFRENILNSFAEADSFKKWIESAPEIQASLERWEGPDTSGDTDMLEHALRAILPTGSDDKVKSIAEALSMPLDRVMPDLGSADKTSS